MKTQPVAAPWRRRSLAGIGLACLLFAGSTKALDVIDPTGAIYTNVTNSSQFAAAWGATNLFTHNMSAISVGQSFGGPEWAKSGSGSAYVAFEVDQVYSVGSVYWAQRNGASTGDNMQRMSIWTSETTPFTAANPGTPPDNVINLQPNVGASVWREYILTNIVDGRYFLLFLEQTAGNITGNPGGNEMRLGLNPPPTPPSIVQAPEAKTIYTGGSVFFEVATAGSVPMTFQWHKDGVALQNNSRISGATSSKLVVSDLSAADLGNYTVGVTNAFGGTVSAAAALSLIPAPTADYPAAVMANPPVAYWRFDEAAGPSAFDYAGGYNGLYGPASALSAVGPRPPQQPGFENQNAAVQTTSFLIDSAVTLPPLNLSTNNRVTITAWVRPDGEQQPFAGIVFSRAAGTIAGLSYNSNATRLAYQWAGNRVNFDSGISLPVGEWSMVALVVTPTNATLYAGTNQSVRMAVDTFNQPVQTFGGSTMIGLDVSGGESARTFNGAIDEVAIYERALSEAEIMNLFAAGVGSIVPLPVEITGITTNQNLFTGERLNLAATVTGTSPISYQWYRDESPIAGATNATYVLPGVRTADAADYYLIAQNQANSATSSVVTVNVSSSIVRVLDPTGAIYTNALADRTFANNWGATNLFKTDVSNIPLGASIGSQAEYARSGGGDAWVRFEVDQVYTIGALYWAHRAGSGTGDNMQQVSLWASETTAFSTNDPGTPPAVTIPLELGNLIWNRHLLPEPITGRYFLMHMEQTTITGNPGAAEVRLGVIGLPAPLEISVVNGSPVLEWPSHGVLQHADALTGPWVNATGITSGSPVPATAEQKFFRVLYY
ncbi:MAG TPA: LamG-like jellyroll fold domain-containing protein [Verrucomicrobiae bacterium]|nr:LamG-like jellyroll fold domain-containing protein [Verrucomicrobiae bacterium]